MKVGPVALSGLLLCTYALAFADRQVLGLFLEPIRLDLDLDDLRLGLLHGYGFSLLYALAALAGGVLVDWAPRLRLLGAGVLVWSLATVTCGWADGLPALTGARLFVGLGQAVLTPAAYSLLGDVHRRERIGLATAGFAVGPFLGLGLMLMAGGGVMALAARLDLGIAPWRLAFVLAGLAGLPLGAVLMLVAEPPRVEQPRTGPRGAVIGFLRSQAKALSAVIAAMVFANMAAQAMLAWAAAWFSRIHGLGLAEAGTRLGWAVLGGGLLGTVAGGLLGDRLRSGGSRLGRLQLLAVCAGLAAASALAAFGGGRLWLSAAALGVTFALLAAALSAGPAALQDLTPPWARGSVHGLAVLAINLLGVGMGPLLVGALSQALGQGGLGTALLTAVPLMLAAAALCAWLGSEAYGAGLRRADQAAAPGRPSSTE